MFIFFNTTFVVSMIVAFVKGWELTLVILAVLPLIVIVTAAMSFAITSLSGKELKAYGKAAIVAEEVLGAIRQATKVLFKP